MKLAEKIINSGKPFHLFHTWEVDQPVLFQAISEHRSIDLDISVDEKGNPYLGHSKEYHELSGEKWFNTMPLWNAIKFLAASDIVINIDCKHHGSWAVIEEVISQLGPDRCLVGSYVSEFRFQYSPGLDRDYPTEWSAIDSLLSLKRKFPDLTVTADAKGLPDDLFVNRHNLPIMEKVRTMLCDFGVDTVCLSIPDRTIDDKGLRFFLDKGIIVHLAIDGIDISNLRQVFIGETDYLANASTGI